MRGWCEGFSWWRAPLCRGSLMLAMCSVLVGVARPKSKIIQSRSRGRLGNRLGRRNMGRKYFRGRNAFGNELAHCRGSRPKMAERRSRCKRERARAIRASLVSRVRTRARAQLPDDPLPSWHIPRPQGGVAWRMGDIRRSIVYLLPERALRFPLSPNFGKIF